MILNDDYLFLGKALFIKKNNFLVIGDLQLGYEQMLKDNGIEVPLDQLNQTINDLEKVFSELENLKLKPKKIVLLGDIKHYFSFNINEKLEVRDFLEYLETKVLRREDIILIKGNHERFFLDNRDYKDFFIEGNIAFLHGHKNFLNFYNHEKNVDLIIMAHLHPAVCIEDDAGGITKEKYKCFLVGNWKGKKVIIIPSFFPIIEGSCINIDYKYSKFKSSDEDFSMIPKSQLREFNVFIPEEKSDKVLDFGKLKDL